MSLAHQIVPAPQVDRIEHTPPVGVKFHEYANLFPMMEGQAYRDLVEDIRQNGVREPIVFLGDAILDGRNRYVAAREAGVEYPRVEFTGDDPLSFVISHNLKRRHLTESQRAMVAKRLETMKQGRPSEKDANLHVSRDTAAKMLSVSPRSVATAAKVIEDATPEVVEAVDKGSLSVSGGAFLADQPPEVQREVVAQPNVKKAVSDLRKSVVEAAKQGGRTAATSNKNPHYQAPTKAGEAWTKLYGSCRALSEWATDENLLLALHGRAERTDDQSANVAAIQKAAEILNKFLGDINAQ